MYSKVDGFVVVDTDPILLLMILVLVVEEFKDDDADAVLGVNETDVALVDGDGLFFFSRGLGVTHTDAQVLVRFKHEEVEVLKTVRRSPSFCLDEHLDEDKVEVLEVALVDGRLVAPKKSRILPFFDASLGSANGFFFAMMRSNVDNMDEGK